LIKCRPDVRLFSRRVLEFNHCDGQAVDKADEVGTARLLDALYGELVHYQKLVEFRLLEIHQPHAVAALHAISFHCHTIQQQLVKGAITLEQRRLVQLAHPMHYFIQHGARYGWVQAAQRIKQSTRQYHLPVICTLRRIAIRCDIRAVNIFPAGVLEPGKGELLEVVFSNH
jgi:hypothetical protein